MGKIAKTSLILKDGDVYRRLAKLVFGSDGSYYATLPCHSSRRACLIKMTANYDAGTFFTVQSDEFCDVASVDDESIKLSHHPDGFSQFSGPGVISGRNADGTAKGMAVFTSPLHSIFRGPAFNYGIQNIDELDLVDTPPKHSLILDLSEYFPIQKSQSVVVEAHYFVPYWRRFMRLDSKGRPIINIQHPSGANVELCVFPASMECEFPGILGFELYRFPLGLPNGGYTFGGPGELLRRNEHGQRIADCIYCMYPREDGFAARRSLNFPLPES